MCENEASGQQAVEHLRAVLRASQNVAYRDATGLRFGDAIPAYANAVEFLRALDAAPIAPSTAAGERNDISVAARALLVAADDIAETALPPQWNSVRDALRAALAAAEPRGEGGRG